MKRLMSQGDATLSTFTFSRVIHFMGLPRNHAARAACAYHSRITRRCSLTFLQNWVLVGGAA
jgi:hypothetical protein